MKLILIVFTLFLAIIDSAKANICDSVILNGDIPMVIRNNYDLINLEPSKFNSPLFKVEGLSVQEILAFNKLKNNHQVKATILEVQSKDIIKLPAPTTNELVVKLLTTEEANKYVSLTLDDSLKSRMSYLPKLIAEKTRTDLLNRIQNTKNVGFFYKGELVGLLVYQNVEVIEKQATLVAWIWRSSGLDFDLRLEFKMLVVKELKENSLDLLAASVHPENISSIKFFSKLGFEPRWVYVQ